MPVIFIRHGDDEDPDPTHRHDPRVTSTGKKEARRLAKKLLRYGSPEKILISPLQRGRDTIDAMKKVIPSEIPIYYEPRLSRYFTSTERAEASLYPATQKAGTPVHEGKSKFRKRIYRLVEDLNSQGYLPLPSGRSSVVPHSERIIWCITHALVIKRLSQIFKITTPSHIPFLYVLPVGLKKSSGMIEKKKE